MAKLIKYANGLKVCVVNLPVRSVMVGFWVGAGSRYETKELNGISHFTEHVMFKGTKTLSPYDIANRFESYGAMINAFTSKEATCYYFKCVDTFLDKCFALLSDIFFNSTYPEDELDKERKVIVEELNMVEDAPDEICSDLLANSVFGGTSLGQTILGPKENILRFNGDDVREYIKSRYTPDNTVIVLVGNVTEEKADELVQNYALNYFHSEKLSGYNFENVYRANQITTKIKDFEQTNIVLAYPSVAIGDNVKIAEQAVLSCLLGGGMSSRLFQSVRERSGLAYSIYTSPSAYNEIGCFNIYLNNSPENTEKALKAIKTELDLLLDKGITDEELQRTKVQLISSLVFSDENIQSIMIAQGKGLLRSDKPVDVNEKIADIEEVSAQAMLDFAAARFISGNLSVAYVGKQFDGDILELLK